MQNETTLFRDTNSKTIEKSKRMISTRFSIVAGSEGARKEMDWEGFLNWRPGKQVFFVFLFFIPYTYFYKYC